MLDDVLTIDALTIISSQRILFPLKLTISQHNFESALTEAWVKIDSLRQSLLNYDRLHGKLLLSDLHDDIKEKSGLFKFQSLADGGIHLTLMTHAELIFDFQSTLWRRLEAIAMTLDYLHELCKQQNSLTLLPLTSITPNA